MSCITRQLCVSDKCCHIHVQVRGAQCPQSRLRAHVRHSCAQFPAQQTKVPGGPLFASAASESEFNSCGEHCGDQWRSVRCHQFRQCSPLFACTVNWIPPYHHVSAQTSHFTACHVSTCWLCSHNAILSRNGPACLTFITHCHSSTSIRTYAW